MRSNLGGVVNSLRLGDAISAFTYHVCCQVANALSALQTINGAVRVKRYDHSNLYGFDMTATYPDSFNMEYIIYFRGAAKPHDLPLLAFDRMDSINCGK